MRKTRPVYQRFLEKVLPGVCCVEWTGTKNTKGYGAFLLEGKMVRAHRAAWTLFQGPIPADMHVLHKCDNPACVQLSHLFLGTNDDNIADKVAKRRTMAGERHTSAKLNREQVERVRRLYASGHFSHRGLGRMFNVHRETIRDIVTGLTWRVA